MDKEQSAPAGQTARPSRRGTGWRRWELLPVLPGLAVTALVLIVQLLQPPAVGELANLLFDTYERLAPRQDVPTPVRIVDIDDESLAKLGQWPWPRTDVARMMERIAGAGAASIALDIVFSEPDRTSPGRLAEILRKEPGAKGNYAEIASMPDHDWLFGQTLARVPAVTAYFLTDEQNRTRPVVKAGFAVSGSPPLSVIPGFEGAIVPLPSIDHGAAGSGFVSLPPSSDGIVRSVPLLARIGDEIVPSLSLETLRVAQGAGAILIKSTSGSGEVAANQEGVIAVKVGNFVIPTTRTGELRMYYRLPRAHEAVPAWKIMTGALSDADMKHLFDGTIVFIGTGAIGLHDLASTPVADKQLGVSVHAQAVEQMILQRFLIQPDWATGLERTLIILFGVVISLLLPSIGALRGGVLASIAFVGSVAGSWYTFRYQSLLLDPTYPALGVVSVYVAETLVNFYREERARAYIHRAFDRYLSPELVKRIAEDPSQLNLGGEERDMTVLFCDIRGFSRISEHLSPPNLISFLIEFLTPMSDILLKRKATIDKYIGDAILAFWNAPLDDPDHAANAARGALEMVEQLKQLNASKLTESGTHWPGEVRIGIGLDSGMCCVGNIGSTQRLNYSLIGDTVNLASRLEGMTKVYGVAIAAGHGFAQRLKDFAIVEIDIVRVVGRDTPEPLFALVGTPELTSEPQYLELTGSLSALLSAYRRQDWSGAEASLDAFKSVAGRFGLEKLAGLYEHRIALFRKTPPAANWDGVYEATEK